MTPTWTQKEAIELCCKVEAIAKECNWHVALTGGCLYKEGTRKDVDLLFYKVRQHLDITNHELLGILFRSGFTLIADHNWCVKATCNGKPVDLLFPENGEGVYPVIGVDKGAGDDTTVTGYYTKEQIEKYRKEHGETSNPPVPDNPRPPPSVILPSIY